MSIYSDYKCGALGYNEMISAANWEARRDQAMQELEEIECQLNYEFDSNIKSFLEDEYDLDVYVEYSFDTGASTTVYDMNNNEVLITVDSEYAEDVLNALIELENNGTPCFPTMYEDYKLHCEFMKILKESLKNETFKKRWTHEPDFASNFYEQTIKTLNIA